MTTPTLHLQEGTTTLPPPEETTTLPEGTTTLPPPEGTILTPHPEGITPTLQVATITMKTTHQEETKGEKNQDEGTDPVPS